MSGETAKVMIMDVINCETSQRSNPNFQTYGETAEASTESYTCVFWDLEDFQIPEGLSPFILSENIESALKKKGFSVDFPLFNFYGDKASWPDINMVCEYRGDAAFLFYMHDGEDKISRTGWMLLDIYVWLLDNPSPNPEAEYNILIVSNNISKERELVLVLKALKSKCHNVLLVQREKLTPPMEAESFGIESLDWLLVNLVGGERPFGGERPVGRERPSNVEDCPRCGKIVNTKSESS